MSDKELLVKLVEMVEDQATGLSKVESISEDVKYLRNRLDGNGQPGLIKDMAGMKLQVKILWAIAAAMGGGGISAAGMALF